ncbi:cyclic peptide export ABC transporter [Gracilimonas sediminicola]|nr:cyclic peptide export ABC transporter [Gracilimonas sediminicola]
MRFIALLIKSSMPIFLISSISSALTGLCSTFLIKTIHQAVTSAEFTLDQFLWNFGLFALGYMIFAFIASYSVSKLIQSIVHKLREDLSRKILKASFESVEKKQPKLLAILTEDIKTIAYSLDRLPGVTTGIATVLGIVAYLVFYSPILTVATIVLFALVFLFTKVTLPFVKKYSDLAREQLNDLYQHFEGLVFGIKELTLNKDFKESYLNKEIIPTSRIQNLHALKENVIASFSNRMTDIVLLMGLGGMIIAIYKTGFVDLEFFGQYLTLVLFTLAPLSTASGFLSNLKRIETALEQIESIGLTMDNTDGSINEITLDDTKTGLPQIELEAVVHQYLNDDGGKVFELGPIDLKINQGEVIFLVGGNGSGKTTLAKIITGLYKPVGGNLKYYGQPVNDRNLKHYRSHFATVFSDSYVFDHLHHISVGKVDREGDYLIELLELTDKVSIVENRFTTKKLSDGQRKRLSLIQAILEDKDIYLLDEWAAHQDPHFKTIFYNKIIPFLTEKRKTVIVITHDDRYFDTANRVVKMQDGNIAAKDSLVTK